MSETSTEGSFDARPGKRNPHPAKAAQVGRSRMINIPELRRKVKESHTDTLTGLFNGNRWKEDTRDLVGQSTYAIVAVDANQLKAINDVYSWQVGNNLLVRIGNLLTGTVDRNKDTAYRLGGDDFRLLLRGVTQEQAKAVAGRLLEEFTSTVHNKKPSVSIGWVYLGSLAEPDRPYAELCAEAAMKNAKELSGSRRGVLDSAIPSIAIQYDMGKHGSPTELHEILHHRMKEI